jgi:uncharacterized protein YecE (DUF72 family)
VGTPPGPTRPSWRPGWYPDDVDSAEERLRFYAEQFPLVEVDSTYYTPPNERNSALWSERTPATFTFNVKAFSLLTQHPTKVSALYKDLRPETDKRNVYLKDLDAQVVDEVWERFLGALEPLHAAGQARHAALPVPAVVPDRASATSSTCSSARSGADRTGCAWSSATRPG